MTTWDDGVVLRTLVGECRGEPNEGRRAVAHVLLNRLQVGRWGHTLAQVCLAHAQFSCWLQSDPNWKLLTSISDFDPIMLEMAGVLSAARQEPDFTNHSTFYFATSMVKAPIWTLGATFEGQFGSQKFYSGVA